MIQKEFDSYVLICDECGVMYPNGFDTFYDAVDSRKEIGWKSKKDRRGNWRVICPECQHDALQEEFI